MPSKPRAKKAAVTGGGLPLARSRRRAVILAPAGMELLWWLDRTSRYAQHRRFDVVAVASRPIDALRELAEGRADVIVVARTDHLMPAVEVVSDPPWRDDDDPMTRRPSRRTGRIPPEDQRLDVLDVDPRTLRPRLLPEPESRRPRRL